MDADAWKILIGAIAVITSGLGGQWLAGRNSRLSAESSHEREKQRWAIDLKYKTYLNLIQQIESSFKLLTRAGRGEGPLDKALLSVNNWKAPDLRLVGSPKVRELVNEVGAAFRQWHADLVSDTPDQDKEALRQKHLMKFQELERQIRSEIGATD